MDFFGKLISILILGLLVGCAAPSETQPSLLGSQASLMAKDSLIRIKQTTGDIHLTDINIYKIDPKTRLITTNSIKVTFMITNAAKWENNMHDWIEQSPKAISARHGDSQMGWLLTLSFPW